MISGLEEARLIHLGVLQAVPAFEQRLILVDIGGGSTEVLVGERGETLAGPQLQARRRPTDRPVLPRRHGDVEFRRRLPLLHPLDPRHVRARGRRARVRHRHRLVGHAEAIARIIHARDERRPCTRSTASSSPRDDLQARGQGARPAPQRRRRGPSVPGLDAERADIIVAGALVLERCRRRSSGSRASSSARPRCARACCSTPSHACRAAPLAPPARRVAPSVRHLAERCDDDLDPLHPRRPTGPPAVRRHPVAARPRPATPASTSRPARCWPTSAW